jgi:hypothetical protein
MERRKDELAGCQGRDSQLPDHGRLNAPPRNTFAVSRFQTFVATQ